MKKILLSGCLLLSTLAEDQAEQNVALTGFSNSKPSIFERYTPPYSANIQP